VTAPCRVRNPPLTLAGQGGVVGGRPAFDQVMPDYLRPAESDEEGAGVPVTEHPSVSRSARSPRPPTPRTPPRTRHRPGRPRARRGSPHGCPDESNRGAHAPRTPAAGHACRSARQPRSADPPGHPAHPPTGRATCSLSSSTRAWSCSTRPFAASAPASAVSARARQYATSASSIVGAGDTPQRTHHHRNPHHAPTPACRTKDQRSPPSGRQAAGREPHQHPALPVAASTGPVVEPCSPPVVEDQRRLAVAGSVPDLLETPHRAPTCPGLTSPGPPRRDRKDNKPPARGTGRSRSDTRRPRTPPGGQTGRNQTSSQQGAPPGESRLVTQGYRMLRSPFRYLPGSLLSSQSSGRPLDHLRPYKLEKRR
jgi:hypothetical protein